MIKVHAMLEQQSTSNRAANIFKALMKYIGIRTQKLDSKSTRIQLLPLTYINSNWIKWLNPFIYHKTQIPVRDDAPKPIIIPIIKPKVIYPQIILKLTEPVVTVKN